MSIVLRLTLAVLTGAIAPAAARAAFITQAAVGGYLHPIPLDTSHNNRMTGGVSATAASSAAGSSGTASINLSPGPTAGIRLTASADTGDANTGVITGAGVQWMDVIRTTAAVPPPALRVTVAIEGTMSAGHLGYALSGGYASAGVASVPLGFGLLDLGGVPHAPNAFGQYDSTGVYLGVQSEPYPSYFHLDDDSTDLGYTSFYSTAVSWTRTFDLEYRDDLGGYGLSLYFSTRAEGYRGGFGTADFGNTFRLTGVTQTDGSAVDGLTFDSGFVPFAPEPSAVPNPAPPGLLALAAGGLGLGVVRRRRR